MYCWWECKFESATVERSFEVSQRLKVELPYNLASLLLDIWFLKIKTLFKNDIDALILIEGLFLIAKICK